MHKRLEINFNNVIHNSAIFRTSQKTTSKLSIQTSINGPLCRGNPMKDSIAHVNPELEG